MTFEIRKAERRRARARIGIDGPAGSGKTHSALRVAKGLGGKVIVIDTESGSAEMESGKPNIPEYDVLPLTPPHAPKRYVEAIHACEEAGADVIIIDSLSHAWAGIGGALDQVDRIAGSGNRFTAWRDVTPQHNALVDAMLQSPAHVIVTMRTKMEYALETDDKGKTRVRKLGMAPVQREGMDYEMTVVFDVDQEKHYARASKDRTSLFDGQPPEILTDKHGTIVREWLEGGTPAPPVPKPEKKRTESARRGKIIEKLAALEAEVGTATVQAVTHSLGIDGNGWDDLSDTVLIEYGKALKACLDTAQVAQVEN